MKKAVAIVFALLIALLPLSALGEGKLRVTQKNFYVLDAFGTSFYGYLFAKVENEGDAPIAIDEGKLVVFDTDDNIVDTDNYISSVPSHMILQPGDYTYLYNWSSLSDVSKEEIGDIKFSVGSQAKGTSVKKLAAETTFHISTNEYSYDNYIYVTFANDTVVPIENIAITAALLDAEGNLLFVAQSYPDNIILHPGSAITIKLYIDNDFVKYYQQNHVNPVSADAAVYYVVE